MKNGKTIPLTIGSGTGKNPYTGQFTELLPVNILTVPPTVLDHLSLRSFPGVVKIADVDGVSRGALRNPADAAVYRVCGKKLYRNNEEVADIDGDDRVAMAGSIKSVALASQGKVLIFNKDGSRAELKNWPPSQYFPGESIMLMTGSKATGYDGTLELTEPMVLKGKIILSLTPASSNGALGQPLELDAALTTFSQDPAPEGTPYITDAIINGFYIAGTTVTVSYTLNLNGAEGDDATEFMWTQIVTPTNVANAQWDLGYASDIVQVGSRYAWVKKGTNTFGVTDPTDETKPDRYRPFTTAESFPDPAVGIGELNNDVVLFGTISTEFFTESGSVDSTQAIYRSQPAAMINIGIAGPRAKALAGREFAVISHPATGKVSVYLLGSGQAKEIASPAVVAALASTTAEELADSAVEYLETGSHRLIIVRFGNYSFCYDRTSKAWCQLCTGGAATPHRYTDFSALGGDITAGSTRHGSVVRLDATTAAQEGESQPHLFYTNTLTLNNNRLFDLELSIASGTAGSPENIYASASTDGVAYPAETPMRFNAPQHYFIRPHLARVGFVSHQIGFRFRILSSAPFSVSSCQVRVS